MKTKRKTDQWLPRKNGGMEEFPKGQDCGNGFMSVRHMSKCIRITC